MGIIDDNKSKIYSNITSSLRRIWLFYSTERKKRVENCKVARGQYKCERCGKIFTLKEINIHHVKPCGSLRSGIDEYLRKLFCSVDDLKAVCKECHLVEHQILKENN